MTNLSSTKTIGQFTITDRELLDQVQQDHEYSYLVSSDHPQVIRHHLDNIVLPVFQKIEFVRAVLNTKSPIIEYRTVNVPKLPSKVYASYAKNIEPLLKHFDELIHCKLPSEILPGVECNAFDHALSKLTSDELELLANRRINCSQDKDLFQPNIDVFLRFCELIKSYFQDTTITKKIRDQSRACKKMKMSCVNYITQLFKVYSRLLVVRADFSLKRSIETLLKNGFSTKEIQSKHDLASFKNNIRKLLNNKRNNPFMKEVIGYIIRFEYTVRTGFHAHAYFFFDGNKHREDISLAQGISDLWRKVTNGQGNTYICNMKKDQYRFCGIGMIHYSDLEKQHYLFKTFDYICKTEQLFEFTNMLGARRFQLGVAPQKTTNVGRPREQLDQLNLNF